MNGIKKFLLALLEGLVEARREKAKQIIGKSLRGS